MHATIPLPVFARLCERQRDALTVANANAAIEEHRRRRATPTTAPSSPAVTPPEADSFWSGILAAIHGAQEPRQAPAGAQGPLTPVPPLQGAPAASYGTADMAMIARRVATTAGYTTEVGPGRPGAGGGTANVPR
jgi:hypothetical protein